jgi:DNA invertase Pin-like site-specific DNA recombinase
MLVGYARISTQDQNLDLQRQELNKAGCKKIYENTVSGKQSNRQGLTMALEVLRNPCSAKI